MKKQGFLISAFVWIAGVTMAIVFNSCAINAPFLTSSVVPAAQGTVKVNTDQNKNYVIKIHLNNFAEANRLTPPMNTYVIWMLTPNNETKNIGQINSSTGFMSKNLSANFQTVSPIKPVKIFITAENDASIQYPQNEVVLTTDFLK